MILKEIALEEIDWEDESFRISEELDSAAVLDSLRAVGQLNPILLLDQHPRQAIVCGFRRARGLRQLGCSHFIARILSDEARDTTKIFECALRDNLSHRQLNGLEKARALFKLKDFCGVSGEILVRTYLPLLGLTPHESVLHAYLKLNSVRPGLRRCLAEGRLTLSSIQFLAMTPAHVQDIFASLMTKIQLSASLQKKVLELFQDLSAISNAQLQAPLDNPEISIVLDDSRLSPFQKGDKLFEILYRLRNPRLARALERFSVQKKLLGLPGSIRLTPHPFFETADLHVEFNASNTDRFRELAAALQKASQSPDLEELFKID
jgi:hypothetical protein